MNRSNPNYGLIAIGVFETFFVEWEKLHTLSALGRIGFHDLSLRDNLEQMEQGADEKSRSG